MPRSPLEKTLKVSFSTAKIYHREQKLAKRTVVCSRCLKTDHHVSQCTSDIVCRVCKCPGHKRGDPGCELSNSSSQQQDRERPEQQQDANAWNMTSSSSSSETGEGTRNSDSGAGGGKKDESATKEARRDSSRGRRSSRLMELDHSRRERSGTPSKRNRSTSKDRVSPGTTPPRWPCG